MKNISLFKLSVAVSLLLLLGSSSSVLAQQENKLFFGVGYNITQPLNNTFTDKTGLYGGHVEAEYYIDKTYSVGLNVSWNTLLKYIPTKTYALQYEAGDITTDMYNSVYNMAYTLFGRYHFKQSDRFQPFVGLALGAQNTEFAEYYSIYQDRQTAWGFIARPEIGTVISISKNNKTNLITGLDYFYSTNANKFIDIKNIQGFEFKVGIQFNLEKRY
ncbi:MAG: outer membrane beta-barrel protein [Bacteroidetes bacterium]|nr:outer membrane beta-barrel protein [Bacteroidota bacterium]